LTTHEFFIPTNSHSNDYTGPIDEGSSNIQNYSTNGQKHGFSSKNELNPFFSQALVTSRESTILHDEKMNGLQQVNKGLIYGRDFIDRNEVEMVINNIQNEIQFLRGFLDELAQSLPNLTISNDVNTPPENSVFLPRSQLASKSSELITSNDKVGSKREENETENVIGNRITIEEENISIKIQILEKNLQLWHNILEQNFPSQDPTHSNQINSQSSNLTPLTRKNTPNDMNSSGNGGISSTISTWISGFDPGHARFFIAALTAGIYLGAFFTYKNGLYIPFQSDESDGEKSIDELERKGWGWSLFSGADGNETNSGTTSDTVHHGVVSQISSFFPSFFSQNANHTQTEQNTNSSWGYPTFGFSANWFRHNSPATSPTPSTPSTQLDFDMGDSSRRLDLSEQVIMAGEDILDNISGDTYDRTFDKVSP
jgi:hypothetical protein